MIRFALVVTSFALGLLLVLSCQSRSGNNPGTQEKPKLSQEQMVAILIDIHLTEAALRIKLTAPGQNDVYASHYYKALFKKHKATKEEFNASLLYYKDDLKTLNNIYMKVVDSLSRMQGPAPAK